MEDYKPFKIVSVLVGSTFHGITSVYDAAKFMLEQWPEEDGPKARMARAILLKCLEGGCSAAVARVAFVEALREAEFFIQPPREPTVGGKPDPKWKRKYTLARDRRPSKG